MAKLLLIGRLGKDPEVRYTKNNKEYVSCVFYLTCARYQSSLTYTGWRS